MQTQPRLCRIIVDHVHGVALDDDAVSRAESAGHPLGKIHPFFQHNYRRVAAFLLLNIVSVGTRTVHHLSVYAGVFVRFYVRCLYPSGSYSLRHLMCQRTLAGCILCPYPGKAPRLQRTVGRSASGVRSTRSAARAPCCRGLLTRSYHQSSSAVSFSHTSARSAPAFTRSDTFGA